MEFLPSVYEHAAFLLKLPPSQVACSQRLMADAHIKAYELYGHSPITVGIDIYNIEAERHGAEVFFSDKDNRIPAIINHPCHNLNEVWQLKPFDPEHDGRAHLVIAAARDVARRCPKAKVVIPLSGLFSLLGNLLSPTYLLMELSLHPKQVRETLFYLIRGQMTYARSIIKEGLQVSMFESGASPPLVSPDQFHDIILPPLKELIAELTKLTSIPTPCIIGGDTLPILPYMLETGTDFLICPAKTDQYRFIEALQSREDIKVRINLSPEVVEYGPEKRIISEFERIRKLANNRPNILFGTGAVPYSTPPEHILLLKNLALKN